MSENKGLDPIFDENSRVLILGTVPGEMSIEKGEYYSDSRNRFWSVIYYCFDEKFSPAISYCERKRFILEKGVALWDVGATFDRVDCSSLDKNTEIKTNTDLKILIEESLPNLECIILNGKNTEKEFNKYKKKINYEVPEYIREIPLESTSPANAKDKDKREKEREEWYKTLSSVLSTVRKIDV